MKFCAVAFLSLNVFLVRSCPPVVEQATGARIEASDYRLPENIKPIWYNITLEPRLEEELVLGSLQFKFRALENTKNVTIEIRSVTINYDSVALEGSSGSIISINNFTWYNDTEHYVLNLDEELNSGDEYTLTIGEYQGILHTDNGGFYLAKYVDEDGNEKRLATTQFQSTNARRAFPCLDEPALKATFTISLIRPENYSSLSNENTVDSVDLGDGRYKDVYAETVNMSTYLVAFVVSDFDYTEQNNQRVYARPQAIKDGRADYALKAGLAILDILADYLQVNYSLPKMHQIAIPDDYFAAGAMENWGLVTYRESYLLYSETLSLNSELQRIATVIAHEFGHQWFGNLVTLSWWEYLWLNEGFATYFEYYAASLYETSWRLMDQYIPSVVQYGLARDCTESTEALNYATTYPGGGAPTYVSYQKGGSVIRMFEHFLTTELFKKGLTLYLNNRQFDAATPSDLYSALQQVLDESGRNDELLADLEVATVLQTWDSIKGYPVVNIERDYTSGSLTITQSRFWLKNDTEDTSVNWYIPINFVFSENSTDFSETTADFWITQQSQTVSNSYPTGGWLVANKQVTGFYRVNYDTANWQRLISQLNSEDFEEINVLNRAQLIDDSLSLARSGRLDYQIALDIVNYLERETDYIPWYTFLTQLDFLNTMLAATDEYDLFKEHVIELLQKVYASLGLEEIDSDSHVDGLNRANILKWLCKLGHDECRSKAQEEFQKWKSTGEIIAPNLQTAYFCGAIAIGDEDDFDFLYTKYEETEQTPALQRTRIVNGLGCSENEEVIKKYLSIATNTSSSLESKYRTTAFSAVYSSSKLGLQAALNYVKDNYDQVKEALSLSTVLSGIGALMTTQDQLDELEALMSSHGDDASSFTSAITSATENVDWISQRADTIQSWISQYAKGDATNVKLYRSVIIGSLLVYCLLYTIMY